MRTRPDDDPRVSLLFVRLPDGGLSGASFTYTGEQTLTKLVSWTLAFALLANSAAHESQKFDESANTIYQWRTKFGGMSVSDMQRLRELEAENARLKKMYADLAMDNSVLKEALTKKF